jgi:hypothetical protein
MSSADFGFSRLTEQAEEYVTVEVAYIMCYLQKQTSELGWTPIEALFYSGFAWLCEHRDCEWTVYHNVSLEQAKKFLSGEGTDGVVGIFPQCQLEGWRVDFLIGVGGFSESWLIVECDGHDFHERTKEQAAKDRARDRKAQAEGFTVFRFTGAELYRDPLGCAEQVRDWVRKNS